MASLATLAAVRPGVIIQRGRHDVWVGSRRGDAGTLGSHERHVDRVRPADEQPLGEREPPADERVNASAEVDIVHVDVGDGVEAVDLEEGGGGDLGVVQRDVGAEPPVRQPDPAPGKFVVPVERVALQHSGCHERRVRHGGQLRLHPDGAVTHRPCLVIERAQECACARQEDQRKCAARGKRRHEQGRRGEWEGGEGFPKGVDNGGARAEKLRGIRWE
mmetsp:Transcript_3388/g.8496  ORF Transcript_3388/g.8496 Transcript_3388/m.8496 type:complete len:218 (+) Transcript_3388:2491-3144(+)